MVIDDIISTSDIVKLFALLLKTYMKCLTTLLKFLTSKNFPFNYPTALVFNKKEENCVC